MTFLNMITNLSGRQRSSKTSLETCFEKALSRQKSDQNSFKTCRETEMFQNVLETVMNGGEHVAFGASRKRNSKICPARSNVLLLQKPVPGWFGDSYASLSCPSVYKSLTISQTLIYVIQTISGYRRALPPPLFSIISGW